MAARSAWRGAITFGGFPINVAAYKARCRASERLRAGLKDYRA